MKKSFFYIWVWVKFIRGVGITYDGEGLVNFCLYILTMFIICVGLILLTLFFSLYLILLSDYFFIVCYKCVGTDCVV